MTSIVSLSDVIFPYSGISIGNGDYLFAGDMGMFHRKDGKWIKIIACVKVEYGKCAWCGEPETLGEVRLD